MVPTLPMPSGSPEWTNELRRLDLSFNEGHFMRAEEPARYDTAQASRIEQHCRHDADLKT